MLAEKTPCDFVAFDLLALDDRDLGRAVRAPARGAGVGAGRRHPAGARHADHDGRREAAQWFEIFEGAGLDGLIAKPADIAYVPGKRLMYKIKHARTADCVVAGFRYHKTGDVVGSLLLGLFDDEGRLHHVGVSASFTARGARSC